MTNNKDNDLMDQLNRLLEWLHQSDGQHIGSHITLIKVEKGAQYVNHIGSQVFNTDEPDVSAKDHSPTIEPPELPEPLATPEAMVLWQKAQQAGYVNEHFQPRQYWPLRWQSDLTSGINGSYLAHCGIVKICEVTTMMH